MSNMRYSLEPLFYSFAYEPKEIKATQAQVDRIYKAAFLGLKDSSLALAAGLLPAEFRQLLANDPWIEIAIEKARAESELHAAQKLSENVEAGDTKAIAFKLTHMHGYMPARPEGGDDNTLIVKVVNSLPSPDEKKSEDA